MKPYHTEGLLKASLLVIFILVPLPFLINWLAWGDDFTSPLIEMYFPDRCVYEDNKHNVINACMD